MPEPRKAPLGGNTVATDRGFLARDMAELEAHLHYRIIDVSSIKELSRRWFPRAYFAAPTKNGGHRALADIRESIAELRYYREAVFVPPPGPSTEQARAIAARHVVDHGRAWSGAPPSSRYDGSRCGRNGILGCRAPVMVGVAQLVEHLVVVQVAAGSSPVTHPTVSSPRSACAGRGFALFHPARRGSGSGSGRHSCEDGGMLSRRFASVVVLVIVVAFVVVAVAPAFAASARVLGAALPADLLGPQGRRHGQDRPRGGADLQRGRQPQLREGRGGRSGRRRDRRRRRPPTAAPSPSPWSPTCLPVSTR